MIRCRWLYKLNPRSPRLIAIARFRDLKGADLRCLIATLFSYHREDTDRDRNGLWFHKSERDQGTYSWIRAYAFKRPWIPVSMPLNLGWHGAIINRIGADIQRRLPCHPWVAAAKMMTLLRLMATKMPAPQPSAPSLCDV